MTNQPPNPPIQAKRPDFVLRKPQQRERRIEPPSHSARPGLVPHSPVVDDETPQP